MNSSLVLPAILIGLGATLTIDVWALLLRRVFAVRSLDYRLLGRWVLHMPRTFVHANIASAESKPHERAVGWTAHYSIGAAFGVTFVAIVGDAWLGRPTLLPALVFGVVTVLVPWFTLQPAFGLGVASAKAPNPTRARLKSLMTHTVFGLGLWAVARLM